MTSVSERIRGSLVGLRMPRALEILDRVLQRVERGEVTALEAIDELLLEEYASREDRRTAMVLHTVLNQLLENCSAWEGRQPGHPGPIRFPGKSASA